MQLGESHQGLPRHRAAPPSRVAGFAPGIARSVRRTGSPAPGAPSRHPVAAREAPAPGSGRSAAPAQALKAAGKTWAGPSGGRSPSPVDEGLQGRAPGTAARGPPPPRGRAARTTGGRCRRGRDGLRAWPRRAPARTASRSASRVNGPGTLRAPPAAVEPPEGDRASLGRRRRGPAVVGEEERVELPRAAAPHRPRIYSPPHRRGGPDAPPHRPVPRHLGGPPGHPARARAAEPADLVLENAVVHTVDAKRPRAEAVAVRGNRIVAVGSTAEVRALVGPKTRVLDLRGRTVVPGFDDSHAHLLGIGFARLDVDLVGTRGFAEVVERVAKAVEHAERPASGSGVGAGTRSKWDAPAPGAVRGFPTHARALRGLSRQPRGARAGRRPRHPGQRQGHGRDRDLPRHPDPGGRRDHPRRGGRPHRRLRGQRQARS